MTKVKTSEGLYSQEELQKQFTDATRRAAETDRLEPRAVNAYYDKKTARIVIELTTGVIVSVPPGLLQGLAHVSPTDLSNVRVSPQGTGLHWETLDSDFSVSGLLTGVFGTRAWMADLGRRGGRVTSQAKAAAEREPMAKKGGVQRKQQRIGVFTNQGQSRTAVIRVARERKSQHASKD